jgi:hypothetical protein
MKLDIQLHTLLLRVLHVQGIDARECAPLRVNLLDLVDEDALLCLPQDVPVACCEVPEVWLCPSSGRVGV